MHYKYGTSGARSHLRDQVPYKTTKNGRKGVHLLIAATTGLVRSETEMGSVRRCRSPEALMQSYSHAKAKSYKEFKQTMEWHTNASNNTSFADAMATSLIFWQLNSAAQS